MEIPDELSINDIKELAGRERHPIKKYSIDWASRYWKFLWFGGASVLSLSNGVNASFNEDWVSVALSVGITAIQVFAFILLRNHEPKMKRKLEEKAARKEVERIREYALKVHFQRQIDLEAGLTADHRHELIEQLEKEAECKWCEKNLRKTWQKALEITEPLHRSEARPEKLYESLIGLVNLIAEFKEKDFFETYASKKEKCLRKLGLVEDRLKERIRLTHPEMV